MIVDAAKRVWNRATEVARPSARRLVRRRLPDPAIAEVTKDIHLHVASAHRLDGGRCNWRGRSG